MSNSVRPHPWDSPGKNTGVGCNFLLQCIKVKSESKVTQSRPTLRDPHGLQPTRLLRPWDFPGKSTGVGCHCLLRNTPQSSPFKQCSAPLEALQNCSSAFSCYSFGIKFQILAIIKYIAFHVWFLSLDNALFLLLIKIPPKFVYHS